MGHSAQAGGSGAFLFGGNFDAAAAREEEVEAPDAGLRAATAEGRIEFPLHGGVLGGAGKVVAGAGRDVGGVGDGSVAVDGDAEDHGDGSTHAGACAGRDVGQNALGDIARSIGRTGRGRCDLWNG